MNHCPARSRARFPRWQNPRAAGAFVIALLVVGFPPTATRATEVEIRLIAADRLD